MPLKATQKEVIEQLYKKDTPHGHIGHAMNAAQRLIHRLNKVTINIQITGRLRHLDLDGHTDIKIVCATRAYKNLLGKQSREYEFSQVHQHMLANKKHYLHTEHLGNEYIFHWSDYKIHLYHTWSTNEMAVAQIVQTGPAAFTHWFLHDLTTGPLPWGYTVIDYQLRDSNKKLVTKTPQEKDVFNALGYNYIFPIDRDTGDKEFWQTFKIDNP